MRYHPTSVLRSKITKEAVPFLSRSSSWPRTLLANLREIVIPALGLVMVSSAPGLPPTHRPRGCRHTPLTTKPCPNVAPAQSDFRPDELEEFKEAFALFDDSGSGTIEVRPQRGFAWERGRGHGHLQRVRLAWWGCTCHPRPDPRPPLHLLLHRAQSLALCFGRSALRQQRRMSRTCSPRRARR